MKRSKTLATVVTIPTCMLMLGSFLVLEANNYQKNINVFGDQNSDVVWKHYKSVEPSLNKHGSKEFYANCSSLGNHVLAESGVPKGKIINDHDDVGFDFSENEIYFDSLGVFDDRYILPQSFFGTETTNWNNAFNNSNLLTNSNLKISSTYSVPNDPNFNELKCSVSFDVEKDEYDQVLYGKAYIEGYMMNPSARNYAKYIDYIDGGNNKIRIDWWNNSVWSENYQSLNNNQSEISNYLSNFFVIRQFDYSWFEYNELGYYELKESQKGINNIFFMGQNLPLENCYVSFIDDRINQIVYELNSKGNIMQGYEVYSDYGNMNITLP